VYALAHQTLQRTAERDLGARLLVESTEELHAWAGPYQAAGWPADTPDFVLERYFAVTVKSGDLDRVSALARDTDRHQRLFRATGSDLVSLNEITGRPRVVLPGYPAAEERRLARQEALSGPPLHRHWRVGPAVARASRCGTQSGLPLVPDTEPDQACQAGWIVCAKSREGIRKRGSPRCCLAAGVGAAPRVIKTSGHDRPPMTSV
jgi:hypothetical protein